mmetsp:Transcript_4647/g.11940  ORF Transcript_4647/g.11940 Transcript_4647/m.11940 type:complete len:233 (-) Transcript_4647:982-1680(-)
MKRPMKSTNSSKSTYWKDVTSLMIFLTLSSSIITWPKYRRRSPRSSVLRSVLFSTLKRWNACVRRRSSRLLKPSSLLSLALATSARISLRSFKPSAVANFATSSGASGFLGGLFADAVASLSPACGSTPDLAASSADSAGASAGSSFELTLDFEWLPERLSSPAALAATSLLADACASTEAAQPFSCNEAMLSQTCFVTEEISRSEADSGDVTAMPMLLVVELNSSQSCIVN